MAKVYQCTWMGCGCTREIPDIGGANLQNYGMARCECTHLLVGHVLLQDPQQHPRSGQNSGSSGQSSAANRQNRPPAGLFSLRDAGGLGNRLGEGGSVPPGQNELVRGGAVMTRRPGQSGGTGRNTSAGGITELRFDDTLDEDATNSQTSVMRSPFAGNLFPISGPRSPLATAANFGIQTYGFGSPGERPGNPGFFNATVAGPPGSRRPSMGFPSGQHDLLASTSGQNFTGSAAFPASISNEVLRGVRAQGRNSQGSSTPFQTRSRAKPPVEQPVVMRTYPFRVFLFRFVQGNMVTTDNEKKAKGRSMETRFMEAIGLVRLIRFERDDSQYIHETIMDEFKEFLPDQSFTLLTRKENGVPRGAELFVATFSRPLSIAQLQSVSEPWKGDDQVRLWIGPKEFQIYVSYDLAEQFCQDAGVKMSSLNLGYCEELEEHIGNRLPLKNVENEASTSAAASNSRSGKKEILKRYINLSDSDDDLDSEPDFGKAVTGRKRFAAQGNVLDIITVDVDNSVPAQLVREAAGSERIFVSIGMGNEDEAVLTTEFEEDDFPTRGDGPAGWVIHNMIADEATGGRSEQIGHVTFQMKVTGNVSDFIQWHKNHADLEEYIRRPSVNCNGAIDTGGPFREWTVTMGDEWKAMMLPDLKVPMFENCETVMTPTSVAAVTESDQELFTAFGGWLFIVLCHKGQWPPELTKSLFRRQLGLPIKVNDIWEINEYVGRLANHVRFGNSPGNLVLASEPELEAWLAYNSGFSDRIFQCCSRDIAAKIMVEWEIMDKRQRNAQLIYEGFCKGEMYSIMRKYRVHWRAVEDVLYSALTVYSDIRECFVYTEPQEDWNPKEKTVYQWLLDAVDIELAPEERRKFLRFVTGGYSSRPTTRIMVIFDPDAVPNFIPLAGVCGSVLTIGLNYPNKSTFVAALREAIPHAGNPLSFRTGG